ncbi:MAG TPA: hypothetical protein VGX21_01625 [Methylomirabilota bacterium]|jgi:hypothetical protein|nr:hypothetical protein [Methylomirabilota bacterium]
MEPAHGARARREGRFGRLGSGVRCLVAYEFDGAFGYLSEMQVHVAERVGDAALAEGFAPWTST